MVRDMLDGPRALGSGGASADRRPRIWIITPVYFDVDSFGILRTRVIEMLERNKKVPVGNATFVVVDDSASHDPRIAELRELADVEVIQPPFNLGHQRALVYAIRIVSERMSDEDIVLTLDADGEDRPEDVPEMLSVLMAEPDNPARIALALRTAREESRTFKVMYFFFRLLFRILTGETVRTGNFIAYRGWTARRLLNHPYFDLCYSSTFKSLGVPLQLVPCPRGSRYAGKTHMTYSRLITHGMRMLMPFLDRIAVRALIVFSITFGLGLAMAVAVLGIRLFTTVGIPGWATSTLLLVLTLCFTALGNFVVLFALFSQSRGISLANLESSNGHATLSSRRAAVGAAPTQT